MSKPVKKTCKSSLTRQSTLLKTYKPSVITQQRGLVQHFETSSITDF